MRGTATSTRSAATEAIAPWPVARIESDGDYRTHAYLEGHIGGPLYTHQAGLPRLPLPTIDETINRFLPTALPLAKSTDKKASLKAACGSFPEQAKHLQERLIVRRETDMQDTSWLQLWWNQVRVTGRVAPTGISSGDNDPCHSCPSLRGFLETTSN